MNDFVKKAMSIPKQHTLKHYVGLVCALYGENEADIEDIAKDAVEANLEDLDGAIDCFRGLLPKGHDAEQEVIKQKRFRRERCEMARKLNEAR